MSHPLPELCPWCLGGRDLISPQALARSLNPSGAQVRDGWVISHCLPQDQSWGPGVGLKLWRVLLGEGAREAWSQEPRPPRTPSQKVRGEEIKGKWEKGRRGLKKEEERGNGGGQGRARRGEERKEEKEEFREGGWIWTRTPFSPESQDFQLLRELFRPLLVLPSTRVAPGHTSTPTGCPLQAHKALSASSGMPAPAPHDETPFPSAPSGLLGWSKSSFGFSITRNGKTGTNFFPTRYTASTVYKLSEQYLGRIMSSWWRTWARSWAHMLALPPAGPWNSADHMVVQKWMSQWMAEY